MKRILLLPVLMLLVSTASARDDKEQAEKLRKEIAELRAQIAAKEAEVAKLDPVRMVEYLWTNDMKPGDVGRFGLSTTRPRTVISDGKPVRVSEMVYSDALLRIEKVIDKTSATAVVLEQAGANKAKIFISNFDTTNVADGRRIPSAVYRVVGTKKIGDVTYTHVEVWTLDYKKPKK